jgi:hypothetical protein
MLKISPLIRVLTALVFGMAYIQYAISALEPVPEGTFTYGPLLAIFMVPFYLIATTIILVHDKPAVSSRILWIALSGGCTALIVFGAFDTGNPMQLVVGAVWGLSVINELILTPNKKTHS